MYTASVIFDYYCRDSELSYIGGIGFQSTPHLEGAGVFNVPEGDSPQNTEPPFTAWFELLASQTRSQPLSCLTSPVALSNDSFRN